MFRIVTRFSNYGIVLQAVGSIVLLLVTHKIIFLLNDLMVYIFLISYMERNKSAINKNKNSKEEKRKERRIRNLSYYNDSYYNLTKFKSKWIEVSENYFDWLPTVVTSLGESFVIRLFVGSTLHVVDYCSVLRVWRH